jgi:lysophospholipase L1-like esterase
LSVARPTVTAGAWTASLTPNADITPSGTAYKVTETADRVRYVHYIEVGSGGGTVHDLLVDPPASLASAASEIYADAAAAAAVSVHTSDTSDAHDASAVSVLDTAGVYTATEVESALAEVAVGVIPAQSALTLTAGAVTVPATAGRSVTISLTANATVTLATPPVAYRTLDVIFVQDATGGRTVTFSTSVQLAGGSLFLNPAPAARTKVRLVWDNGAWSQDVSAAAVRTGLSTGNRTIIIGDSIATGGDDQSAYTIQGSWFARACAVSRQRLRFYRNAGVPGNTSTAMLARFATDVIAYAPDIVVIAAVTPNDPGQGVSQSTAKSNIQAMTALARAAGIKVMFASGPPSDNTTNRAFLLAMNQWLLRYANSIGVDVIDICSPLIDSTDGTYLSSLTSDGTHFSTTGLNTVAAFVASNLPSWLRAQPFLTQSLNDPTNLITNGVFVGDSNADGLADNWFVEGGTFASKSLSAISGGYGNWQTLTCNGGIGYIYATFPGGSWSVGDVLALGARYEADAATEVQVRIICSGAARNIDAVYNWTYAGFAGECYLEAPIPSGTNSAYVRLLVNTTAGAVRFGQVTVRNLTTLGLV